MDDDAELLDAETAKADVNPLENVNMLVQMVESASLRSLRTDNERISDLICVQEDVRQNCSAWTFFCTN